MVFHWASTLQELSEQHAVHWEHMQWGVPLIVSKPSYMAVGGVIARQVSDSDLGVPSSMKRLPDKPFESF